MEDAEPGDILEVRVHDIRLRPSRHRCWAGRCFGSNVAAKWGFHYHDLIEEPKPIPIPEIPAGSTYESAKASAAPPPPAPPSRPLLWLGVAGAAILVLLTGVRALRRG